MPEAKARIRSEPLTLVLEAISGISGLTVKKYPITTDKDKAIEIPTAPIFTARRASVVSPRVVASDNAIFRPSKGAITIEPMTIRLWDTTGKPMGQPLQGHQAAVSSVA
jgi:hypothetical protein